MKHSSECFCCSAFPKKAHTLHTLAPREKENISILERKQDEKGQELPLKVAIKEGWDCKKREMLWENGKKEKDLVV